MQWRYALSPIRWKTTHGRWRAIVTQAAGASEWYAYVERIQPPHDRRDAPLFAWPLEGRVWCEAELTRLESGTTLILSRERHLALRQNVYHALGAYHKAAGAYWDAVAGHAYPFDPAYVEGVRTTAAALDTAINALRAHLGTLGFAEEVNRESEALMRFQELLARELALLPSDT